MQRGKFKSVGEQMQETEDLARVIYKHMGYGRFENLERDYMRKSQHPTEMSCYRAAEEIIGKYFK